MRVLFVPMPGPAHIMPLLNLQRACLAHDPSTVTAFLQPALRHTALRRMGVEVLDLDHMGFIHTEVEAYRRFRPDLVIDDNSFTTGYATSILPVPRITLLRTGTFPGYVPRDPRQRHSLPVQAEEAPDVARLGLTPVRQLTDYFHATMAIVPGIPAIEQLPEPLREDRRYVFAGPLLLSDESVEQLIVPGRDTLRKTGAVYARHQGRPTVLITTGTVVEPTGGLQDAIRRMLDAGICVFSTIDVPTLSVSQRYYFTYAQVLPMHAVCAHVDLVIHQCGSGTYHYPLLHGRSSITLGTGCYDREDVAWRLQELGVSTHLPDYRRPDLADLLPALVRDCLADVETRRAREARAAELGAEIRRIAQSFRIADVLQQALAGHAATVSH